MKLLPKLLPTEHDASGSRAINDLAVLPVFYRLEGKTVVVVGGSDAAAWKAELLSASGACVRVFAPQPGSAMTQLLRGERSEIIDHQPCCWGETSFDGAVLAIGDIESDADAAEFQHAAHARGVHVNVIDKPDYCDFQFGSIVNRSPTVVAISTNGASPILGQRIRQRIEMLLPTSVSAWTRFAQHIRPRVMEALNTSKARRQFWNAFATIALSQKYEESTASDVDNLIYESRTTDEVGSVSFVGAGPGDAELLTIKALRALQNADVVLFDNLVSNEVLDLSRREARRMLVGKRGGRRSCRQDDINGLMVKLAKAGKHVVRLKSGDPVIFGRLGEEIAFLEREQIAWSIEPGITAASAMAAQLGVSLTHRNHAHSVRFVTGHSKHGSLPMDVNWQSVADPTASTIFYMGGRTAAEIKRALLQHGMDKATATVVCTSVSSAHGRSWRGTLADIEVGVQKLGYDEPVLIGIGDVFSQASGLADLPSTSVCRVESDSLSMSPRSDGHRRCLARVGQG